MKTYLLTFALFVSAFILRAQDTTLPQGKCEAVLSSGRALKDIKLWSHDRQKLEYLKDDNLHDVLLSEINYFKFTEGDYAFSDSLVLYKIVYDAIIFPGNETLYCFIKEIRPDKLTYCLFGEKQLHTLYRADLKKYLLKGYDDQAQYIRSSPIQQDTSPAVKSYAANTDFYAMGREDGKKEYRGNGSLAGGMVCGVIPLFGWITAPITLAVPPFLNPVKTQLFNTNKLYAKGYEDAAKRKKAKKTTGGFLVGLAFLLVLAL